MMQLLGIVAGVAVLCGAGAVLKRGGSWAGVIGDLLIAAGGLVAGFMLALILVLATWPGACVAVLCPSCYQAPTADQLWRFSVVYFVVLGGLGGLLPSRAFRAGYAVGVIPAVAGSAGALGDSAAAMLLGVLAWAITSAVRHALSRWVAGPPDAGDGPNATDFWDGTGWQGGPPAPARR